MARESREAAKVARGEPSLTIIAPGTRVVGEVASDGVVKIEGTIVGTVKAEHQVLVSRGGVVEGDIDTKEAVLGGEVKGGVVAERRVEVQSGSVVSGDIVTERLIVQEGGEVNGNVRMGKSEATTGPGRAPQQGNRSQSPAAVH